MPSNDENSAEKHTFGTWLEQILKEAPHMIASFEQAFPGATWAFIGRDTALIADVFEMFYSSIGQIDRVVRLQVSKATFQNASDKELVEYLTQKGALVTQHPFILVDVISTGGGQQARSLLSAWYRSRNKEGVPLYQLVRSFNIIGLTTRTTPESPLLKSLSDAQLTLETEESTYSHSAPERGLENIQTQRILMYKDQRTEQSHLGINESGYEQSTGAWHDTYGKFQRSHWDPRWIVTKEGSEAPLKIREGILAMQSQLQLAIDSNNFLHKVQLEAREKDYEFPLKRASVPFDPLNQLQKSLWQSDHKFPDLADILYRFKLYNMGRVHKEHVAPVLERWLDFSSTVDVNNKTINEILDIGFDSATETWLLKILLSKAAPDRVHSLKERIARVQATRQKNTKIKAVTSKLGGLFSKIKTCALRLKKGSKP